MRTYEVCVSGMRMRNAYPIEGIRRKSMHEVCARMRYAYQVCICSGMRMLRIRYVYQVCVCSAVSAQEMREGNQKK